MIIKLLSGREMHYAYPSLSLQETPWSRDAREAWKQERDEWVSAWGVGYAEPQPEPEYQLGVSFMVMKTGRWTKVRLYGGMITENVVQAIARDILALALIRLDKAGYALLLSTHDEALAEQTGLGTIEDFERIMTTPIPWAPDWPITGDSWTGRRYRK